MVSSEFVGTLPVFKFNGDFCIVESAEGSAVACKKFDFDGSVLGFDIEHLAYVPPVPQGPPGKRVAWVQLTDGEDCYA